MLNDYQGRRQIFGSLGGSMRSDLIFGALKHVSNRFLLAKALATATRACHKPGTRIQNTTNDVLASFGRSNPIAQEDAVPIATTIPTRRSKPLLATRHQAKRLNIPAVLDSPHSLPEALRPSGNWAKL
jgi:hypothetical protein